MDWTVTVGPTQAEKWSSTGTKMSSTLFTITINSIFESIKMSVGKSVHVDDLALFYSAKAMAMIVARHYRHGGTKC